MRYKARLISKEILTESEGVDYTEVFSPVMCHTLIRVLLSLMAKQNMELEYMDVKITFPTQI